MKSEKKEIKEWEIWAATHYYEGNGAGGFPPTEPVFIGKESASEFDIACLIYEHRRRMEYLIETDQKGGYISHQDREWFYDWRTNSCAWLGKYYPSKEEAMKEYELKN